MNCESTCLAFMLGILLTDLEVLEKFSPIKLLRITWTEDMCNEYVLSEMQTKRKEAYLNN